MARVEVDDRAGAEVDRSALVAQAEFLMRALALHPDTELAISLVDRAEMADLHERWLDLPGPTDVLSFPMDELRVPEPGEDPVPGVLGDVVLCPSVAAEQAAAAGQTTAAELELLLTHGVLHLLGHDHAEPDERAAMFALQDRLLASWRELRSHGADASANAHASGSNLRSSGGLAAGGSGGLAAAGPGGSAPAGGTPA